MTERFSIKKPLYHKETADTHFKSFFFFLPCPVSSHHPSLLGYPLCRFPEVSRVRQPAVELRQLLQHVGQLGERRPLPQVVSPAGRKDLLRQEVTLCQHTWRSTEPCSVSLREMINLTSYARSGYLRITRAQLIICATGNEAE